MSWIKGMPGIVVLLLSTNSWSDQYFYAGLKGAHSDFSGIEVNLSGRSFWQVDDSLGYGVYSGYSFTELWAIELEYLRFETETNEYPIKYCDRATLLCIPAEADYEASSYSVYGVYRTTGKIFFKWRLGYSYQESQTEVFGHDLDTRYANELSASIGGGIRFDGFNVEAEYTYSADSLRHLSIGISLCF